MASQPALDAVISHWSTLVEDFRASPLDFYNAVEAALKRREIPLTENSRVDFKEAGFLSANREYFHVVREKLVFDICGAPFGTGFFFSWWFADARPRLNPALKLLVLVGIMAIAGWLVTQLGVVSGLIVFGVLLLLGLASANQMASQGNLDDGFIRVVPLISTLYLWLFKPGTYYRIDSMEMFQKAVHNAVLEVIDQMTTEKGLRALAESERKPVMHQFYDRKGR